MDTPNFFISFLIYWLLLCASCYLTGRQQSRRALAVAIPCGFVAALALAFPIFQPWQRLWFGSVGLLFTIKASVLLLQPIEELRKFSTVGLLIYMSAWPGMDPLPFAGREKCVEDGRRFVQGYICFWIGLILLVVSSFCPLPASGWLGLVALLFTIHLGYASMLTCSLRLLGWNVQPLFDAPLLSISLQDFWSRRWNRAFVEMDKLLFLPILRRWLKPRSAIFAIFAISGLLHEAAISYPSGQLWGLPLLYFLIQGFGLLMEKQLSITKKLPTPLARAITLAWIIAPISLLFNDPFRAAFIEPLSLAVHQVVAHQTSSQLLSTALWLAAIGHFCTLMAGLQVPFRLHWKEELKRLSNFNRKIMLNYAAYVGLMIIAFGWLTFALHDELMIGEKAAMYLAAVIAIFWILRLLVDRFYFSDTDWPKGPEFVIGHALLNTLFIALASVYSYVVLTNWLWLPLLRLKT